MVPRVSPVLKYPIFNTSEKYPIGETLSALFPYESKDNTRKEKAPDALDVVSPSLCGMSSLKLIAWASHAR